MNPAQGCTMMKLDLQQKFRLSNAVVLPLLVVAAGLCGQPALAGGNGSGQPSGTTVAGSSTTPTATMSGLTSVIMTGSGPTSTVTTSPVSGGGTQTITTVTLPASTVNSRLGAVGLAYSYDPNVTYRGPSGTTYSFSATTDSPGSAPSAGSTRSISIKAHKITLGTSYNF